MRRSPAGRSLVAVTLAATLSACTSWRPTTASPDEVVVEDEYVRVTTRDGTRLTLGTLELEGDSLVGRTWDCRICPAGGLCGLCSRPVVALADARSWKCDERASSGRGYSSAGSLPPSSPIVVASGGGDPDVDPLGASLR